MTGQRARREDAFPKPEVLPLDILHGYHVSEEEATAERAVSVHVDIGVREASDASAQEGFQGDRFDFLASQGLRTMRALRCKELGQGPKTVRHCAVSEL